jgi:hypothetical protein
MRSQDEQEVYNRWANEDAAHENAMIEESMREDQAMERAKSELALYGEISTSNRRDTIAASVLPEIIHMMGAQYSMGDNIKVNVHLAYQYADAMERERNAT